MMDMLVERRLAVCLNCRTVIREYQGSITPLHWSHDKTGTKTCPGAPEAAPDPHSVRVAL